MIVNVHIHVYGKEREVSITQTPRPDQLIRPIASRLVNEKVWAREAWWSDHMLGPFLKGIPIWDKDLGNRSDRQSGGMPDDGNIITEMISIDAQSKRALLAAKNFGLDKEDVVRKMLLEGRKVASGGAISLSEIRNYVVHEIDVLAEAWSLSRKSKGELRALVFQRQADV